MHGRCARWALMAMTIVAGAGVAVGQTPGARDVTRVKPPEKWALLVGVNDYSEVVDLQFCGADIEALQAKLIDAGFPADHVFVMTDRAEPKYRPSKGNIERQIELITQLTDPDDLLVVAFSGHGVHLEGASYLCPSDASLQHPQESLVALDAVYERLRACSARQKLLLVDACRNDPVPAGNKSLDGVKSMDEFAGSLEAPEGVLVLSSCKKGQLSVEDPTLGHGVFMYFLLKGLEGDADRAVGNRDGAISLLELYRFASDQTKTHVVRLRNIAQTPTLKGEFSLDYDLALVPEAVTAPMTQQKPPAQPPTADQAAPAVAGPSKPAAAAPVDAATQQHVDGLLKSAATHQASRHFDQAIEAYTSAIRLAPGDKTLYLKRGAVYKIAGKLVEAVADYQAAGSLLPLSVTVESAALQAGSKETGTVLKGQVVNVREWKKVAPYDWLYVENVGGDTTLHGWLLATAVEEPSVVSAATREVTAPARSTPAPPRVSPSTVNRPPSTSTPYRRPPSVWETPEWESPREIREKRARGELR